MGKRLLVLVLALLAPLCAAAETVDPAALQAQQDAALVEALFAAAAGTTTEAEAELRKDMTEEELLARNAENVLWRAQTRAWLLEALRTEETEPAAEPDPLETPFDAQDAYDALAGRETGQVYRALLGEVDGERALEMTRAACKHWLEEIDAEYLTEINEEYACWIYCPDSQIDYPVVHGSDNSYYLHRLLNGEENDCGTLFIDYRNLADFEDPNTLIYGHHMRNGSMFKSITFYEEQAYYEAHPWMLIVTPEQCWLVEMLAGYLTTKDDHCYDIAISDAEDMRAFVESAQEKSDFAAAVTVEPGDRLVTLSTCAYAFERARYIAIGRMEWIGPAPGVENAIK